MGLSKIIIAPIGIITLPERDNEGWLLLWEMDYIGNHPYCGNGHVIFLRGRVSKDPEFRLGHQLKCARCNMVLAHFPPEIETYDRMRRYFSGANNMLRLV